MIYTQLDSARPKPNQDKDEPTRRRKPAHALPTSSTEDPDLALVVGLWDRLADDASAGCSRS